MLFIADLHIHSKYSRATSPQMNLEDLDAMADDKGILVMGTGDFLHPKWFKEIVDKLEPAEPGLFKLKDQYKKLTLKGTLAQTRFILSVEISSIYSQGVPPTSNSGEMKKVRRIHNIVFAPSLVSAKRIHDELVGLGCNLSSDGRPIIGLSSEKLAEIVFGIDPTHKSMGGVDENNVIIPSHAWTPWFSIFGSMSGFDSIEECFGKYADKIFAIETGLSSDPEMNWQLSKLDNVALISNSDSHSLPKIGREANIFDTELSYAGIMEAIRNSSPIQRQSAPPAGGSSRKSAMIATVEFFPEEGKYHYDGHRLCQVVLSPEESKKYNGICPKCGKPLTIGVMNRLEQLADRKVELRAKGNYKQHDNFVPYYNLVGLEEIVAESLGVKATSKKVRPEYEKLIKQFGSELKILLDISEAELKAGVSERVFEAIKRVREGNLKIRPGYDGEYGVVSIFGDSDGGSMEKNL